LQFKSFSSNNAPFTYKWSNGTTTSTINNLSEGYYNLTVTDATGCTGVDYSSIDNLTFFARVIPIQQANCHNLNGKMALSYTLGSSPNHTIRWSNGATTDTISNISAGYYQCTVTDSNGCTAIAGESIGQMYFYAGISIIQNPGCTNNSGIVELDYFNSSALTYSYLWSNGTTTDTAKNVMTGSIYCTVTDANGCSAVANAYLSAPSHSASINIIQSPSCSNNNGIVELGYFSSLAQPYIYKWSNGATTDTVTNAASGHLQCTVTDAQGCSAIANTYLSTPYHYASIQIIQNPSCLDIGSITLSSFSSNAVPFTYKWSNSATSATISNLGGGYYYCTVTDIQGCSAVTSTYLSRSSNAYADIETITVPSCSNVNDGKAKAVPNNMISPYTFLWSNGATTNIASNLSEGIHSCTVTDAVGCKITTSTYFYSKYNYAVAYTISNESCPAFNNGIIAGYSYGLTSPYTYLWSNGATTPSISNLSKGFYHVTVSNATSCKAIGYINLNNSLFIQKKQPTCPLYDNGVL
jgi:hypothetical protein